MADNNLLRPPVAYQPTTDFSAVQTGDPNSPLPATSLDIELANIQTALAETQQRLAMIQRDDGRLANGSVGVYQVASDIIAGFKEPLPWAPSTEYLVADGILVNDLQWYVAVKDHFSTADFNADLAAGNWRLIYDFTTANTAAVAAQTAAEAAQTAAEAAQAAAELARDNAQLAETGAVSAQTGAQTAQTAAETARTAAQTAQTAAEAAKTAAETAAANAASSETVASTAAAAAQAAQSAAEAAQAAAEAAALQAQTGYVAKSSDTGSMAVPYGTTAQRDATPTEPRFRVNSDTGQGELYNPATETWGPVGGGATGGGGDQVFVENDQVVTADYTITAGKNAHSVGPISINNGVAVTVPTGSAWKVS